jgi:outer membrane protein assembly factor BamB
MIYAVLDYDWPIFYWLSVASYVVPLCTLLVLVLTLALAPGARRWMKDCLRIPLAHPWATLLLILLMGVTAQALREWRRNRVPRNRASAELKVGQVGQVAPRTEGTPWPCDRGSFQRRAQVGDSPGPGRVAPKRRWRLGRPGEAVYSSPAVVGNRVYAVGSEVDAGRVIAVDLATGTLMWSGGPPMFRATFSSPTIVGDTLFCGEGLHSTRQARVFALDLRPRREGSVLWSFRTEGHVECSPQVWEGAIFFNAGDDGTYALETPRKPGAVPEVRYHGPGASLVDAETGLLVADGRAYVGLGVGGHAICALDAMTGREVWRVSTGEPVFALPALEGNSLFIGLGGGDYAHPEHSKTGAVWRLDRESLEVVWKREVPGTVLGAVIVAGDQVIFGCGDGRVYSVSLDNQKMTSWDTGSAIAAPLAVTDHYIYGVNRAGTLFAIDRQEGDWAWRLTLGPEGHYVSGPVVVGSALILGTPHDGLVCYGEITP